MLLPLQAQFGKWSELAATASQELCAEGFHVDLDRVACGVEPSLEEAMQGVGDEAVFELFLSERPRPYWEAQGILSEALGERETSGINKLGEAAGAHRLSAIAHYEPATETLFLPKIAGRGELKRYVITHELAHVWQHQRGRFYEDRGGLSSDRFAIRRMLTEGEAELMALAARGVLTTGDGSEALRLAQSYWMDLRAPPDEQRRAGFEYLVDRWVEGGFAAVDRDGQDPPSSTEQLLHFLDKRSDEPTAVSLPTWPDSLGPLEFAWLDTLGEWGAYCLMAGGFKSSAAARFRKLATGWDGDALVVCRTQAGVEAVLWRTVWDREPDAEEFAKGFLVRRPGAMTRDGQIVDWVWSNRADVQQELCGLLRGWVQESLPGPDDGRTAELAEGRQ